MQKPFLQGSFKHYIIASSIDMEYMLHASTQATPLSKIHVKQTTAQLIANRSFMLLSSADAPAIH